MVGEDRLLNAAAAFDKLNQSCVVVDAGTALTIDYIDGKGTFHGGAIVPGAQLIYGPPLEDRFYYDISHNQQSTSFTTVNLPG